MTANHYKGRCHKDTQKHQEDLNEKMKTAKIYKNTRRFARIQSFTFILVTNSIKTITATNRAILYIRLALFSYHRNNSLSVIFVMQLETIHAI